MISSLRAQTDVRAYAYKARRGRVCPGMLADVRRNCAKTGRVEGIYRWSEDHWTRSDDATIINDDGTYIINDCEYAARLRYHCFI